MGDLLNLFLPFVTTPRNYGDVLRKLAACAFYETYLITFFLRDIPLVDQALRSVETYGSLGEFLQTFPHANTLNIAGLGIAFGVAVFTFVFQLHDRISDLLGIRSRFDRDKILIPLAQKVGATLPERRMNEIKLQRQKLMREVFYRYASSRSTDPLVDRHDIEHALGRWAWFWVLVEASTFFATAAIIAALFGSLQIGSWFLLVSLLAVFLACFQYRRLGTYALAEVEAIAADQAAATSVRNVFNAL
ncbi:MAG: hypothetical protein WD852_09820 [Methyloceanibacter sp.]